MLFHVPLLFHLHHTTSMEHVLKAAACAGAAVVSWFVYKATTDPIHVVWDLDATLICSQVCVRPRRARRGAAWPERPPEHSCG